MQTRVLRLDGATNFRDLGGYVGDGGRRVCWRRLFRSDHLGALSGPDRARLAKLGIARSIDFRGAHEGRQTPYDWPGVLRIALPIEPTVAQQMDTLLASGIALTPAAMGTLMRELYRRLVDDQSHRMAEFFEQVIAADGPLVFHCTAGKDRTGLAAALLLHSLGVGTADIERDYLLTNEVYRRPLLSTDAARRAALPDDVLTVLWTVHPSFLHEALATIEARHGGLDRYLADRLGVTPAVRARLADRLLDDGATAAPQDAAPAPATGPTASSPTTG